MHPGSHEVHSNRMYSVIAEVPASTQWDVSWKRGFGLCLGGSCGSHRHCDCLQGRNSTDP